MTITMQAHGTRSMQHLISRSKNKILSGSPSTRLYGDPEAVQQCLHQHSQARSTMRLKSRVGPHTWAQRMMMTILGRALMPLRTAPSCYLGRRCTAQSLTH
jgi:hypothetical protein